MTLMRNESLPALGATGQRPAISDLIKKKFQPWLVGASSPTAKDCGFDSRSENGVGLIPSWGCMRGN